MARSIRPGPRLMGVPLGRLRWRCAHCGHRKIDAVVAPTETVLRPATRAAAR